MGLVTLPKKLQVGKGTPRVAPLGAVEIDWDNPLTRGLSVFTMFDEASGTGVHELVAGTIHDDGTNHVNNTGFIRDKDAVGKHVKSVIVEDDELRLHEDKAIPNGTAVTVLTGVMYDAGNIDGSVLHIGTGVATNNNPLLWADTASGVLRPSFNSGGGSLVGTAGSIPSGQFTIWGADFTAANPSAIRFYVDGVNRGSGSAGNTATLTARPWRYANDSGGNRGVGGSIYLYAVWDRALSSAEHAAFSADPYQVVRSVVQSVYFTASGTGGISPTGIASTEAFGTAVLTTGAVDVSPTGIASGEALGTAVLTTGSVDLAPSGISTAETFGVGSVLTVGARDIKIDFQDSLILSADLQATTLYFNGTNYFTV